MLMPRPIPLPPPVTNALLPSSCCDVDFAIDCLPYAAVVAISFSLRK